MQRLEGPLGTAAGDDFSPSHHPGGAGVYTYICPKNHSVL